MKKISAYILLLTFLLLAGAAKANVADSTRLLLENEDVEINERLSMAYKHIASISDKEQRRVAIEDTFIPYLDKNITDQVLKNTYKIASYRQLVNVYRMLKNMEQRVASLEKGCELAELSLPDTIYAAKEVLDAYNQERAEIFSICGQMHAQIGNIALGHLYYYKAIKLFESLQRYDKISRLLYFIAIDFYNIGDVDNLSKILESLQDNEKLHSSYATLYNLYGLQVGYHNLLLQNDSSNYALIDSTLNISRKIAELIEYHKEDIPRTAIPAYDFFNIASMYDRYYPERYDSIHHYIDKALNAKTKIDPVINLELDVSINMLLARVYFREKKYDLAEEKNLDALALLASDELKNRNTIIGDMIINYRQLADIYEETGRYKEAVQYWKKNIAEKEKQFNQEKTHAINEMRTKYEVEKKEAHIEYLELENETARKINLLIFSLLGILVVAIVFIVISNRLRKKNLQQSIYETALLNELKQTELEKTEEEKQLLQQEYDKLSELAGESKKQAEEYAEQLQSLKQQLEQKPTQSMAQKIQEMVSKSLIDNYQKKEYLEKLSNLDIDMLEQGYLTADEKVTNMDMKYIICFAADMDVKDVSLIFNVEPASVYTVRYRIKKKFQGKNTFKFLI
ncbi:tetratricopeptide repeat protein [Bacteroidales bacterium OttesenSCG-928-J16]|nr:tetratricopeptide repeat protein [Bacteroidales bacterium OttesenSCG-928-J16]